MALDERHRTSIYQALVPLAGEDAAAAMLSHFPARDVEEPVTKEHLDRRFAELRGEIVELRGELRTEIAELRGELRTEIGTLRGELHTQGADLRTEIAELTNKLTIRVAGLLALATLVVGLWR